MYSKVKVTLGIVAGALGFAGLAVGLGAIVTSDNAEDCSKIGLKGSLASCKVDNKYAYDKVVILAGNTASILSGLPLHGSVRATRKCTPIITRPLPGETCRLPG